LTLSCYDLLSVNDLSEDDIEALLDSAASFSEISERTIKKVPALRGRTIINLFLEPSTRTRTSFEIAGKRLSADVINISGPGSAIVKGESLKDTAKTIEAMRVDAVVMRHWSSGAALKLAEYIEPPVINAGDGAHEHPTQALLDALTIRNAFGEIAGRRVAIVGDIAHSRVARSLIALLNRLGAKVTVVAPPVWSPIGIEMLGCDVSFNLDDVLDSMDVLYLLRIQTERLEKAFFSEREYSRFFGVNEERLARAKPGCKVMHPGPMNRGVEISSSVADHLESLVTAQVANGVAVRMAVFYRMLGEHNE
jgi:aspartate carbamoyltransferase catalytic subunit